MLAYSQRINRDSVQLEALLHYWVERIEHLLRACVRDRAILPASHSLDIPFKVLIADDVNMVAQIYQKAGLEMTADANKNLSQFVDQQQGEYGRVIYDLQGQFGIAPEVLRERFKFYFDAFPTSGAL